MICPACGRRCACIDSRRRLAYGPALPDAGQEGLVRERKYVCADCAGVYITRETMAAAYKARSRDKRAGGAGKAENEGTENA